MPLKQTSPNQKIRYDSLEYTNLCNTKFMEENFEADQYLIDIKKQLSSYVKKCLEFSKSFTSPSPVVSIPVMQLYQIVSIPPVCGLFRVASLPKNWSKQSKFKGSVYVLTDTDLFYYVGDIREAPTEHPDNLESIKLEEGVLARLHDEFKDTIDQLSDDQLVAIYDISAHNRKKNSEHYEAWTFNCLDSTAPYFSYRGSMPPYYSDEKLDYDVKFKVSPEGLINFDCVTSFPVGYHKKVLSGLLTALDTANALYCAKITQKPIESPQKLKNIPSYYSQKNRQHFWQVSVLDNGLNLYKEDGELFQSISSGDSLKKEILVSFRYELNQCLEKIQNNEASFTDLSNLIGQLQNKSNLEYKILNKAQDRMTDWLKNIFGANLIQTSSEKALVRMCQDALKIGKGIVSQNQNRQTLP